MQIFKIDRCIYFCIILLVTYLSYNKICSYTRWGSITAHKVNYHLISSNHTHFDPDIIVVGAGLSGAVMAHLFATKLHKRVLVVEKRNHIAGNCFDYINDVNIRVSKYGAHLFHTKHKLIWDFVKQFTEWIPYEHRYVF